MKKALISCVDGLGDIVSYITPYMRKFYKEGYMTTLMGREELTTSHLLDDCPYLEEIIHIPNPWKFKDPSKTVKKNLATFNKLRKNFDLAYNRPFCQIQMYSKLDMTSKFFGIPELEGEDRYPEVFISDECDKEAEDYLNNVEFKEFMFVHVNIPNHPAHTWDAYQWIGENFPPMNIYDTRFNTFDNINTTFAIMKRASRIILSSSVMVHAADALNLHVDAVNYGVVDRKAWPTRIKPRRVRECGYWLEDF